MKDKKNVVLSVFFVAFCSSILINTTVSSADDRKVYSPEDIPGENPITSPSKSPTPSISIPFATGTPVISSSTSPSASPSVSPSQTLKTGCEIYRIDFANFAIAGKKTYTVADLSKATGLSCLGSVISPADLQNSGSIWAALLRTVGSVPGGSNNYIYENNKKYIKCNGPWESPRSDKHNSYDMIGGGQLTGKKGTLTPGCQRGVMYLDTNCKLQVASTTTQAIKDKDCKIDLKTYIGTPISLVWSDNYLNETSTIVNFKLNLFSEETNWLWRASESLPLLVYDPENTGEINSATQLFGNWTFGGNGFASLVSSTDKNSDKNTPWRDGYEALGVMDKNLDGKINGEELSSISLWFDKNRDGISQKGEVVRASSEGITNLYYKSDTTEKGAIVATNGYERILNGEIINGKSIDWQEKSFSTGFGDIIDSLGKLSKNTENNLVNNKENKREFNLANSAVSTLLGGWVYELDISGSGSGMLTFSNEDDEIMGTNISAIKFDGINYISSQIIFSHFDVTVNQNSDNEIKIEFTNELEDGVKLINTASLSLGSDVINGKTLVSGSNVSENKAFEYTWKAHRIKE